MGAQSVAVLVEKRRTEERRALRNAHELSFPRDDEGEKERREEKKTRALSAEEFTFAEIPRRRGNSGHGYG